MYAIRSYYATLLLALCLLIASSIDNLASLLPLWLLLGVGYALVQTPSGRLLTRSCHPEDRPDLFAAQFSLSVITSYSIHYTKLYE